MKNSFLILAGVAALSLASCSQEKTTEVTTSPGAATTTTTTTTSVGPESEAVIEARAQRIADKMVANMKITDAATRTKIRTVYVERARRLNEVKTKYVSDTTGVAAAIREAVAATDAEFKTIFANPTQYQAYESSRSTYDDSNYLDDRPATAPEDSLAPAPVGYVTTENTTTTTTTTPATAPDDQFVGKMKAKGSDGSKIKVKENGKVKIKEGDGTKVKY